MKKIIIFLLLGFAVPNLVAKQEYIDSLTTIDSELKKYFPRWNICEPDLQFQIYQAFLILGFDQSMLDQQDIEVLAAPKERNSTDAYDILLLSCGKSSINSRQLDMEMKSIAKYLSGKDKYRPLSTAKKNERDYCYTDIPIETPIKPDQGQVMKDYFLPSNVTQAFTLSLFNQSLKVGNSGFWVESRIGNDAVGLPFWTAGEASILLRRPLYLNNDVSTRKETPYLINAYLGGSYKLNSGINETGLLQFLPSRKLNSNPNGKINFGLEVNMPFHPDAGVFFNVSTPLTKIDPILGINDTQYFTTTDGMTFENGINRIEFKETDPRFGDSTVNRESLAIAPILQTTGVFGLFYNFWLNKEKAENFFRFEFGVNYREIDEYLFYRGTNGGSYISKDGVAGLNTIHNVEFMDWIFAKVEYRNQAVYPFSVSTQISNQTLLVRGYLPLFANWLFLEAKFSTPLRDALPYETENFFMISPVLRITI